MFADMSKVQDDEVGDGTTSVTVLAAELLRVNTYLSDSDFKVKPPWFPAVVAMWVLLAVSAVSVAISGGGASDRQEDPPTDYHLWLEESDSGGQRGSEGRRCRSQVRQN